MFLGTIVAQSYGIDLNNYLGLHFFLAGDFNAAQLITYMFMHGGFTHLFFNMFAVWMFGRILEQVWGRNASCSTTSHAASVQGLSRSLYNTSITKRCFPHTTVSIPGIPSSPWKNIST